MSKVNWAELAAQEFKLTDPAQAAQLLPAAFRLLASPDPSKRDEIAYPAIATWLEQGYLDGELPQLGATVTQLFQAPKVHTRSFAALILAEVLTRDMQVRTLKPATLHDLIKAWSEWYVHEQDLRSHTPKMGWLHALAHGADVAAVLARHPLMTKRELNTVLDVMLSRIQSVTTVPAQFEDDRLAFALFLLLERSSEADQQQWLTKFEKVLQPTWGQPRSPATAFAVQVGRALLMFTHFGARWPDGRVSPASDSLRESLLTVLKSAFAFAYP